MGEQITNVEWDKLSPDNFETGVVSGKPPKFCISLGW